MKAISSEEIPSVPHKISYREYGHGPIVVLLHGYGGSVMHWDAVVESLQRTHRVIVPNLTHLYMSEDRLLFSQVVDRVAEFIRMNFPGERVTFAGMSFGGALAWGLSVRHAALVDRLILLNPLMPNPTTKFRHPEVRYFFVLPMDGKAILRMLGSPIGHSFLRKAAVIFRPDREDTMARLEKLTGTKLRFVANVMAHFSWILRGEDWKFWARQIPQVQAQTLMIWSEDDQLFSAEAYAELAALFPMVTAVAWSEAGHLLAKSRPDDVKKAMADFLEKATVSRAA